MTTPKLTDGHGLDLGLHVLPPETLEAIKDCTIPLPVRPEHQSRVDEKYSATGYGSIDNAFGCDWGVDDKGGLL